ncbi:nuclear transport factor 2 family protein [Erythrobacter alti]|uniref:nuclear transport factor 2 family protein n=1 Tax=Erythrobacter alti TaxID=1896145 RepID=UPI0030F3F942
MNKQQMLEKIDAIYDARVRGDVPGMCACMAEGATFRFAGESAMEDGFRAQDAIAFTEAVRALDNGIAMTRVDRQNALAEGNQLAGLWKCTVQFPGREAFTTEIFNLWSFDDDGQITDLTEFVDTAKLKSEMAAVADQAKSPVA